MEEKLITIALLPYSKAEILRSLLDAKGISCTLENVNVIQGAVATGVKVCINAEDLYKALPVLDEMLGKVELTPLKTENIVLIPVDFSNYSIKAAEVAIEIAQKFDAKLVFYHVIPKPDIFSIPYSDVMPFDVGLYQHLIEKERMADEGFEKFMSQLMADIGETVWNSLKVEQIVKMGEAEDDILSYTEIHPPRLIVMGTKGPSTDKGQFIGTTTAGIIYKARVPVLVVPEESTLKDISSLKKVVYATNFDAKDYVSIEKLLGLLKPFETELICLHIGKHDAQKMDLAQLKAMNDSLKEKFEDTSFNCKMVEGIDVLAELEHYIEENNIDVLALTTHKRNMITRIFNPSIAKKMVFHLKTPLFVFHA